MPIPNARRDPAPPARRVVVRMVAAAVLLNALMLGFTAFTLEMSRHGHQQRAAVAVRNLAALLERDLRTTIQKIDLALLAVADEARRAPRQEAGNRRPFDAFLQRQEGRLNEVHGLQTTDSRGRVERRQPLPAALAGLDVRDIFDRLATGRDAGLVIAQPDASAAPSLVIARGLQAPDGRFDGIVFATLEIRRFEELFETIEVGPNGKVLMRDGQQRLIARYPRVDAPGQAPIVDSKRRSLAFAASGEASGSFNGRGVDGLQHQVSFMRVGAYPLAFGVSLAAVDYLADWQVELRRAIVFDLAFLLSTCLIARLAWSAWRRREENLQALRGQERKFRTLVESSPDALVIADAEGRIAIVNRQAEAMFEYAADDLVGRPMAALLLGQFDRAPRGTPQRLEDRWALTCSGRRFPVSISLSPIETDEGDLVAAAIRDVTERRASEERIAFLAHHDALTGLPNRIVMQTRFAQAAALADRDGTRLALLFLDLDNFKTVNDSLGHQVGDALLRSVAERLRECTRDIDTISRQGGDEFLLLFAHLPDGETARLMVERLVQRFQQASVIDERAIPTPFSIGVALYPDDGRDFVTLQKHADIAMYQAKAAGRNIYRFFSERMNVQAIERLQLRQELHAALEQGQFVLHYQPQVELATGRIVGVEALVRWQHPQRGLVLPGHFIADAEASGQVVAIGEWVLHEACRQARAWQDEGLPPLVVAVNLSAVQFARGDVEARVQAALRAARLDPAWLELEFTESILIQDVEAVLVTVAALKRLGVKLSIDDFGTGYSSLSYLTRLSFDKLKIDRSFVSGLIHDASHAAIVQAIVQMSRGLGLKTIAEGVEDAPTSDQLLRLGCDEAQGFLFARPAPARQIGTLLRTAVGTPAAGQASDPSRKAAPSDRYVPSGGSVSVDH